MNDDVRRRMMQEIICGAVLPIQEDDEFTAEELAQAGNTSACTIHRMMNKSIEQGQMTRRMVRNRANGRPAWAYRKAHDDQSRPDQE